MNTSHQSLSRILIGGMVGNLTEWYNFLLYGYLATVISQLFFPFHNEFLSLILVFTVFALSFMMRPIGGILFGWIGDRYGRQRALIYSLLMVTLPAFIIGCLPTYQTIGIASPILLSLLRILQGLSAGGEHTGSAVYLAEQAPNQHRSWWVSMVPASAALGILASSLVSLIILNSFDAETLLSWGWRVGYWIGTLFGLLSLIWRLGLPETADFERIKTKNLTVKSPLSVLFKETKTLKNLSAVFGLASCWGVFYQILFIWMPTYLTQFQHLNHGVVLKINSSFLFLFTCLIVLMGYLTDYINRSRLLKLTCFAIAIMAYPIFIMLSSGHFWQINIALGIYTILFSFYIPVTFVYMVEAFPAEIRYTAFSFGFNMGLAIFGGTCPLIVTWLIRATGQLTSPASYLLIAAVVALCISTKISDADTKSCDATHYPF